MTDTIVPSGPNADQIKYWNAEAGTKWSDFNPQLDRMLAPLSAVVIDRLWLRRHILGPGPAGGPRRRGHRRRYLYAHVERGAAAGGG